MSSGEAMKDTGNGAKMGRNPNITVMERYSWVRPSIACAFLTIERLRPRVWWTIIERRAE